MTPRQQAVLQLFDGLTKSQQEEFFRELDQAKRRNDELLDELGHKRKTS